MEDLANEFSNYAMIEDIGSAPCGLMQKPIANKKPIQSTDGLKFSSYKYPHFIEGRYQKGRRSCLDPTPSSIPVSPISSSTVSPITTTSTATKNTTPKTNTTKHRYSTRSRSILLKSNSLALSDSESTLSDDAKGSANAFFSEQRKHQSRTKKSKRKKTNKDGQLYSFAVAANSDQYYGKRKRSTTITQNTYEHCPSSVISNYTTNKLVKKTDFNEMQCDFDNKTNESIHRQNDMELDDEHEEDSASSTLSEDSNSTDPRFLDADDEQSDYYEVSNFQKKNSHRRQYGRTSLDKNSQNPFSVLSSTSPSTSSSLWKRRRRNLPNNHLN